VVRTTLADGRGRMAFCLSAREPRCAEQDIRLTAGSGREWTVSLWRGKTDNRTLFVEGRPGTAVEPCGGADAQVVPGLVGAAADADDQLAAVWAALLKLEL
jgi:hypothetical protein